MMKRILSVILALALCAGLAACSVAEDTQQAQQQDPPASELPEAEPTDSPSPRLAPDTDAQQLSTEPEPSEPEHEHIWLDANYQEPRTCDVCWETEGNPLTPVFETQGLAPNMTLGEATRYVSSFPNSPEIDRIGTATVLDYSISERDSRGSFNSKKGYEWRIATVRYEFDGSNAWVGDDGIDFIFYFIDYYSDEAFTSTMSKIEDDGRFFTFFPITYYGIEHECEGIHRVIRREWVGNTRVITVLFAISVPIGYDGFVVASTNFKHANEEIEQTSADFIDENTLFFRMDNHAHLSELEAEEQIDEPACTVIADKIASGEISKDATELALNSLNIRDVTPLRDFTNLTDLSLVNNSISNIEPLSGLTNLTSLSLNANNISDIEPLRNLTNLTRLNLSKNNISDISPLEGLVNLATLSISENRISRITALRGMKELGHLVISDNFIIDVRALRGLTQLRNIYIYNNLIRDVSPFTELPDLYGTLDLSRNEITDVSAFKDMQGSERLKLLLTRNPIPPRAIDDLKAAVTFEELHYTLGGRDIRE